jgi:hypothetical protein
VSRPSPAVPDRGHHRGSTGPVCSADLRVLANTRDLRRFPNCSIKNWQRELRNEFGCNHPDRTGSGIAVYGIVPKTISNGCEPQDQQRRDPGRPGTGPAKHGAPPDRRHGRLSGPIRELGPCSLGRSMRDGHSSDTNSGRTDGHDRRPGSRPGWWWKFGSCPACLST